MKYDVVLLGSGISSLTSAALLAKKGLRVCVLEQYNKPGGYMHCFSRFGERFDTGAHYVGGMDPGQTFHTLLSYLGVYDSSLFTALDAKGFDVFHFPEYTVSLPKGYQNAVETLCAQFPSERNAIESYYAMVSDAVKSFPTYDFNEGFNDPQTLQKLVTTPLSGVVEKLTSNPELKSFFYSYCVLHGVQPDEVPFGFHALMNDSLICGAHGFTHGGDALAQKFIEVIRAQGGEVHTKKRVVTIETSTGANDKLATAVLTAEGERFEADWFISGAHPKHTFALVDRQEIFSPAFRMRLKNIKETVGIFGLYGVYQGAEDFNTLQNHYYFSSADPSTFEYPSPFEKPNVAFLCPSTRKDRAAGAPLPINIHSAGPMAWFSDFENTQFGKRPEEYAAIKDIYAKKILEFVERYQPRLQEKLTKFATSTPVTNAHFNGSIEGSPYGIYQSIQNMGARALGPRTHIANLLLTGQSTLFPGMLASSISGVRTAGHIVGMKPILKELRELREMNNRERNRHE